MNRYKTLSYLFFILILLLSGCHARFVSLEDKEPKAAINKTSRQAVEQCFSTRKEILNASNKELWQACLMSHNEKQLMLVLSLLKEELNLDNAKVSHIDTLLYYLRSASYFADHSKLLSNHYQRLEQVLNQLTSHQLFNADNDNARRLQEHYAVTFYRYYTTADSHSYVANHLDHLTDILASLDEPDISKLSLQSQYTLWETFRALAFIAYEGRRNDKVKHAFVERSSVVKGLQQFQLAMSEIDWRLEHTLWTLSYIQLLQEEDTAQTIDQQVWQTLDDQPMLTESKKKQLFSQIYLVNSYRAKESCESDFIGKCIIPTINEALPINHQCSASLFIRANQMTKQELTETCVQLTSQETDFHQKLHTNLQPVKDDLNDKLRVVIFDNYSQYNRYGQLTFNIQTNNGGMYIEGKPNEHGNQATFFSFETFWLPEQFGVWNLNHEYMHYLDGRFVKYGGFGHYDSHLVWWSEGLAEFIAKGNDNHKAFKLLTKTENADWPSLATIFATTYSDSADQIYSWSYLAIRFLHEQGDNILPKLKQPLKTNDFDHYKQLLDLLATNYQEKFGAWLVTHQRNENKQTDASKPRKPRTIYRYLYRDYLQPASLPLTERHNHNL